MAKTPPPLAVLVVEDDRLLRWAIAETLRGGGHEVIEAATAQAARVALGGMSGQIDVVLLDYRLPDSTDLRLLDEIRRRLPQAALLLMTASGTPELAAQALQRGVFRVVSKPFDMDDLEELVTGAWRARAAG
jgi:DNA-binding NtrC family response regulator